MNIFRKAATVFALPAPKRRLAVSAVSWTLFVRLGLWLLPFRTLQRLCDACGKQCRKHPGTTVQAISSSIELAARNVPRATCLVQALAAGILLAREGFPVTVHIGVAKSDLRFEAHAWTESEGVLVSGGTESSRYLPILVTEVKGQS